MDTTDHKDDGVLLAARGIVKHFPGVKALDCVDLEVRRGEVHALVGENGAGKSTLMHILAGVFPPDGGQIDFAGQENVRIANEHAAQRLGISIVFQERSLFGDLSVAENIFAGRQPTWGWGHVHRRRLWLQTRRLLDRVRLNVDPRIAVNRLSPAQQQMVEIAKALSLDAQLLILDEPTAALTENETRTLFGVIEQSAREGRGIIYISHRLEEVFQIAGRVTVLKDGKWQGTLPIEQTSPDELVTRMVGRELAHSAAIPSNPIASPQPILEVRGLCDRPSGLRDRPLLKDVSFKVDPGEIVAFAGLSGAGRTETALAVFGARHHIRCDIFMNGARACIRTPRDAVRLGVGYLSEDRKESGLFLEMTLAANIAAANLRHFGTWWLSKPRIRQTARQFRERLRIAAPTVDTPIVNLSGGNQQKALIARWLLLEPKVLFVDEPTRGVDVGVKGEVHALLRELADRGTAIVVISSDLPEVLALADRVLVMREGRIAGELTRAQASEDAIMRLASTGLAA
ncbi:MAG: sugar ABC transporter ATP-binding protein [Pirellulales bacterium]